MYLCLILSNMALEIITGGNWNANVTISMGEMISTRHCIHPIHIMSYNIGLFLENIALENITGGASTANVMISSGNFWPKCRCTRSFDSIEVCIIKFFQIWPWKLLREVTLILTIQFLGANWNTNVTRYIPFTSCPIKLISFWKI